MSNLTKSAQTASMLTGSECMSMAKHFYESGLFKDVTGEAQAVVKIMAGREIGLEPFSAMQGLDIIQGKMVLKPIVMAAKIKSSGKYNYRVQKSTDEACSIEFFENGASIGISTFTMNDASMMGLSGKQNWRQQPSVMLYNRALSKGARQFCPDAFLGIAVYTREELEHYAIETHYEEPLASSEEVPQLIAPPSYNKQIASAVKAKGIETALFTEFLQTVWAIDKLKGAVLNEAEFEGIMLAVEKGAEYLTEAILASSVEEMTDAERGIFEEETV